MHQDPTPPPRRYVNPVIKDEAVFETREDGRTVVTVRLAPGGGNPFHRHRTYAEHFRVVEGELTVTVEGEDHRLGPGQTAVAPATSLHRFANPSGAPVTFEVEMDPLHPGFERAIRVAYGLAADGRTNSKAIPRNPLHTALILEWSDMELHGIPGTRALMAVLAKVGRAAGVERRLHRAYPEPA